MGKINVYDEIVMKKEKKMKIWKLKTFIHKSTPKKILEWKLQLAKVS